MSSIVQTLNLRGVKNPEKVDAVGLQPTASIPFLQYGDPAGIRTPDPLLKRQLLCRLSYRVKLLHAGAIKNGWDGWTRTSG